MKLTAAESTALPYAKFPHDAFSRPDESDDKVFYARDRFVQHLDTLALSTAQKITGELITGANPIILDLMASWDSHIPAHLSSAKVVGLGLNRNELMGNKLLSEIVIHDLNENPVLPFPDECLTQSSIPSRWTT